MIDVDWEWKTCRLECASFVIINFFKVKTWKLMYVAREINSLWLEYCTETNLTSFLEKNSWKLAEIQNTIKCIFRKNNRNKASLCYSILKIIKIGSTLFIFYFFWLLFCKNTFQNRWFLDTWSRTECIDIYNCCRLLLIVADCC